MLYKVEPVVNTARNNCRKIEQEGHQFIDEQMILAKKKNSGNQQYMPKKMRKSNFIKLLSAGKSCIIYDFFYLCRSSQCRQKKIWRQGRIPWSVEESLKNHNLELFFATWFCVLSLLSQLRSMGIPSNGTFRSNRIAACPPMGKKYLKKEGLGAYDY